VVVWQIVLGVAADRSCVICCKVSRHILDAGPMRTAATVGLHGMFGEHQPGAGVRWRNRLFDGVGPCRKPACPKIASGLV